MLDPNPRRKPCYSPTDDRYWDRDDLDYELHRVFDICHSCRLCLSYCPSFPELFGRIDGYIERGKAHGAERLDAEDMQAVVDACFQCKLCYIKCPYTEDEGHSWRVDYPRLALREKANRARRDGVTLQDKVLGEPQLLGALTAGPQAKIANLISANRLLRKPAESVAGISALFPLPKFATRSFTSWWGDHEPATSGENGDVVLFPTCYGTYNTTGPSIAAVQVLEANGIRVHYPAEQTCCGMPNLDGGDVPRAQEKAKQNVKALLPFVRQGMPVLIPGPTCSYTLSKEYPDLIGTPEANEVAAASIDLMKWLDRELRRKKKLRKPKVDLGKIAYHAPCHLRAQKIAFPAVQLLEWLGAEVDEVQQCSAVDGTWGMKAQWYELGRRYSQKLLRDVRESEAKLAVSDCPLAALRIAHEVGVPVLHPIEILARAYGFSPEGVREGDNVTPEKSP